MNREQWEIVAEQVIDLLEGGYFHPNMFNDGRLSTQYQAIYSQSGETMYGLDRHAGHDLFYSTPRKSSSVQSNLAYIPGYAYKTDAARQFWTLIDQANAADTWQWNYKGGTLGPQLRKLAAQIMYTTWQRYSNLYLNPQARQIVEKDPGLMLNFAWATWNGPGFFKYYADRINTKVNAGTTDPATLNADTISARLNSQYSTIRNGGQKLKDYLLSVKYRDLASRYAAPAAGGLAILALFFLTYKLINR